MSCRVIAIQGWVGKTGVLVFAVAAIFATGVAQAPLNSSPVTPPSADQSVANNHEPGTSIVHSEKFVELTTLQIPKVSRAPKLQDFLDHTPREAEAVVSGFRQRDPADGLPVSEPTTAYLSYDDKNLYVVFVCQDEPGKVRARMAKREDIDGDDRVSLYLDTFHDRRRAYLFASNPLGIQSDAIVSEDDKPDYNFDTLWYSDGRLIEDGYIVWMAIPFKSLRFSSQSVQSWGVALGRFILRKNEDTYWPYITKRIEGFTQQMGALEGLNEISSGRNIQLIPYGVFTAGRFLDTGAQKYRSTSIGRYGLDSKIILHDSLTLDATVKPDFSEVESDNPQQTINERFEVFFPEKRPFFIENSDFFQTPVNLFFSRRIADPQFGARLTGKLGPWAIGTLATDDRAPGALLPLSDPLHERRAGIGVVRVRREFGEQSSIGVLATSRDFGNTFNRVFAIDTRLKLNPNWVFTGQAIQSYTREVNDSRQHTGPAYFAELDHSGRHFTYAASYEDFSPAFASRLGFIQRVNIRQVQNYASYLWWPEGRHVLSFGPSVTALADWDRTGRMQDWYGNAGFSISFASATQLQVSRTESYELFDQLAFRKRSTDLTFSSEWLKWLSFFSFYSRGTAVNYSPAQGVAPFLGNSTYGSLGITLRPSERLRLESSYIYSRLGTGKGFPELLTPASVFNNHLLRWKANYQFSRALSLRAILDYDAVLPNSSLIALDRSKHFRGDILLTYLLHPGTALYIGYTDNYENFALDPSMSPALRRTVSSLNPTGRQLFVKISYLLRF